MEQHTDEQLIQQVKSGRKMAMNQLVQRYHIKLFRFFLRMTGDQFAAEDLVQMTFERVYRYRNSFKSRHLFKTWIFQIARNLQSTEFRKKEKKEAHEELAIKRGNTSTSDDYDLQQLIQTALLALPERERELVIFYHIKGFSYKELSILFEISEGNLRVIQCRALKKLGEILKQLGYEH